MVHIQFVECHLPSKAPFGHILICRHRYDDRIAALKHCIAVDRQCADGWILQEASRDLVRGLAIAHHGLGQSFGLVVFDGGFGASTVSGFPNRGQKAEHVSGIHNVHGHRPRVCFSRYNPKTWLLWVARILCRLWSCETHAIRQYHHRGHLDKPIPGAETVSMFCDIFWLLVTFGKLSTSGLRFPSLEPSNTRWMHLVAVLDSARCMSLLISFL